MDSFKMFVGCRALQNGEEPLKNMGPGTSVEGSEVKEMNRGKEGR